MHIMFMSCTCHAMLCSIVQCMPSTLQLLFPSCEVHRIVKDHRAVAIVEGQLVNLVDRFRTRRSWFYRSEGRYSDAELWKILSV